MLIGYYDQLDDFTTYLNFVKIDSVSKNRDIDGRKFKVKAEIMINEFIRFSNSRIEVWYSDVIDINMSNSALQIIGEKSFSDYIKESINNGEFRMSANEFFSTINFISKSLEYKLKKEEIESKFRKFIELSIGYLCPITRKIMKNPVIVSNGVSYEKEAIEVWLSRGKDFCLKTKQKISNKIMIPNIGLMKLIKQTIDNDLLNILYKYQLEKNEIESLIIDIEENLYEFPWKFQAYIKEFDPNIIVMYKNRIYKSEITDQDFKKMHPKSSQIIHLDKAIFLCGGDENTISLDTCYIIKLRLSKGKIENTIIEYPKMNYERSLHSAIYLKNRNIICVCGGKTSEMTDMKKKEWELLPELNEERYNPSLAYINDKFVYCIGGYIGFDDLLNSLEIFNIENLNKIDQWKLINLTSIINLSYCQMGIININSSSIYLCGGYSKNANVSSSIFIMEIDEKTGSCKSLSESNLKLPEESYFPKSNNFSKIKDNFYIYDYDGKLLYFDSKNQKFDYININN